MHVVDWIFVVRKYLEKYVGFCMKLVKTETETEKEKKTESESETETEVNTIQSNPIHSNVQPNPYDSLFNLNRDCTCPYLDPTISGPVHARRI